MNSFLSILLNNSENLENTTSNTNQYSQFEIIFWYSAFIITIILFIIVKKSNKNISKKTNNLISKTQNLLLNMDNLISKIESNTEIKKDYIKKIIFQVNVIESKCLDLKELTKLNDLDKAINLTKEIQISFKEIKLLKNSLKINDIKKTRSIVNTLLDEMNRIKIVLK